jgi:diguanylate cyclase (GGDEF)-like protein
VTNVENLRLLIIEESSSDAESLANELRNSGHSIDLEYAGDLASLETAAVKQNPDIVICGSGPGLPDAASVKAALDKQQPDTPLIAIAEEASEDTVITARKAGITALVSYDRPDHLHVVFKHEAENARLRHSLESFTETLQASEKRCHALIGNSSDAIAYIHDGMHVYANKPYMDLFDVGSSDAIEGMPVLDMISNVQRDKFREFLKHYTDVSKTENTLNIDCISPGGELFNSSMELSPATMDGESCTQIIIRVNAGNNSELEKKIKSLSQKDMLTGLSNRQYFMQQLEKYISPDRKNGRQGALIYLTLDNFKVIREEAGIASSDLVLCDIANLLGRERSQHDLLSRFGECVFTLLIKDTDMEKVHAASEKLLQNIAEHLAEIDGRAFTMTASIGICEITRRTKDAQNIISYADMACEVARTSGGNQIHTHSTLVDDSFGAGLENDADHVIRDTIDNGRFYLIHQPIVSLKGDKSRHYEVLLRITDTEGHVILPREFLAIAERCGLATNIDRWVIDKAFSTLAEYRKEADTTFYIKITGPTLVDPETTEWICDKIQEYKLDSEGIVFEIAEQYAVKHLKHAIDFVAAMQSIRCKVALEHYGLADQTQLLKHIPADIIKIDGSLIEGLSGQSDCQAKVKSITAAVRESEKICIAECVDSANSLALLWQYGVDYIQGYFVQEPTRELSYEFEDEIV